MGGATEHLLHVLGIEMGVDEEEYMKEWKRERELKGAFHDFENAYLYAVAVRGSSGSLCKETLGCFDSDDKAFDYHQDEDRVLVRAERDVSPISGESATQPIA